MAPSPSEIALHIRKSASLRSSYGVGHSHNNHPHTYTHNHHNHGSTHTHNSPSTNTKRKFASPTSSPSNASLSSLGKGPRSPTSTGLSHSPSKKSSRASSSYAPSSYALGGAGFEASQLKVLKEDHGLMTLRYEEASFAKPPIPVTVAPPRRPPTDLHPALRVRSETDELGWAGKRDSGLANTISCRSAAREGSVDTAITTPTEEAESSYDSGLMIDFDAGSLQPSPLVEVLVEPPTTPKRERLERVQKVASPSGSFASRTGSMRNWVRSRGSRRGQGSVSEAPTTPKSRSEEPRTPKSRGEESQMAQRQEDVVVPEPEPEQEPYLPLDTPIPTSDFLDEDLLHSMSFSKRGSIMFGGKKAVNGHLRLGGGRRQQSISMLATPTVQVQLPADIEIESQKVRSMYEHPAMPLWEDGKDAPMVQRIVSGESSHDPFVTNGLLCPDTNDRPNSSLSFRNEHELAGGIEDWEDVNGRDVDRYGFISKTKSGESGTPEIQPPQRVSTILHLASETPRKKRGFGRSASSAASSKYVNTQGRKISVRSLDTSGSHGSQRSISRVRAITNRLPGNADRRWMDEAGDMLTLPPGLADIAEDEEGGRVAAGLKRKEWERAEKWRKMAKVNKAGKDGEGMEFEFDAKNPKLIERTWKGIPDRWRATAWYSFLASSARRRKDSPCERDIILSFHELLGKSSADDQQIDMDVPRTINSHIMFRKRYRGGQRLLFRVLHSLSLYFPATGYVQGMASLAATLLCYYDEEKTFVMLVRMWTLRGLAKLYAAGFGGLMAALEEFKEKWMKGRDVTRKLDELCIEPTSYGTRWYLTLFGYSIPFPAQLRVWDVFMLLGDSEPLPYSSHPSQSIRSPPPSSPAVNGGADANAGEAIDFRGGLDILHATSAALIDGTREILLDSDFENAMKVLTSWIPVKDEELLMRVAKAEWKLGRRGGRAR